MKEVELQVELEVEELEEMLRNLTAETSLGKLVPTWQSNCHADKGPKANTNFQGQRPTTKTRDNHSRERGTKKLEKNMDLFRFLSKARENV